MSSHPNRASGFIKLQGLDKREEAYDAIVQTLFDENGLCRKKLPKGPESLGRAISDALYFTPTRQEEIQQDLLKHLTQLVANNQLTARLSGFHGNSMMLNDFANNPQLPGFEKITLELVSLLYKVKVILYTMNEDHFLTANIFNNNYTKTVEILRAKANHYEAVHPKSRMEKAAECQNVILNLIDGLGNSSPNKTVRNLNNGEFINFAYENSQVTAASPKDNNDQFRITRGAHKKSLSDNFNTNFDFMEEQQNKFFDAFLHAGVGHENIFKNVTMRKDTAESGFSINANFDFIDEQNFDGPYPGQEMAIKNYPMPRGRISPRAMANHEMDSPMPTFSKAKFSSHPNVLFSENLGIAEMDRIERSINTATTQDHGASPFYNAMSPPGLTPTKFSQRTYNDNTPKSDFLGISPMGRDAMSPGYQFGSNSPKRNLSPFAQSFSGGMGDQSFGGITPFAPQQQGFQLQSQQFNNTYMKRMNVGSSVAMQGQDGYAFEQDQSYDQNGEFDQSGPREKKKPIILDESKERFSGRLKFFDENKKYGFVVMDEDGSDIFVHFDDLCKANVTKEMLRTVRTGNVLRFNFGLMDYIGKYNRSRKAIDIQMETN